MRLQHACAHQCLSLRAVRRSKTFLPSYICKSSFIRRLNFSQNINLKERHTHPRNMNVDDDRVTDSSPNCDRNGKENGSTEMAGVLLRLQSSLKQLVQVSEAQTEAFNNLREDILSQPDPNEEDKDVITDGTPNLLS